jgi:hypothetical protein
MVNLYEEPQIFSPAAAWHFPAGENILRNHFLYCRKFHILAK